MKMAVYDFLIRQSIFSTQPETSSIAIKPPWAKANACLAGRPCLVARQALPANVHQTRSHFFMLPAWLPAAIADGTAGFG